jgi:hypothetical protein
MHGFLFNNSVAEKQNKICLSLEPNLNLRRMKNLLTFLLLISCFQDYAQEKGDIVLKSAVSEATVFINGAQVVRKKTVELTPGRSTLRFVDLSPFIDPKSIQVKVNDEVQVMSVNHQFNYADSLGRSKEIQLLNQQIDQMNDRLNLENANLETVNEQLNFLKDNRAIGGKDQNLSPAVLKDVYAFYSDKTAALKQKIVTINQNIKKIQDERKMLEGQLRQLGFDKLSPTGEIQLQLDSKEGGECHIELSYLVSNAGWFPSYDIRSKSIDSPVNLVYKANIYQNTKEEWENIRLRLSSSIPNQGSVAPQLKTYFLNYNTLPPRYTLANNQVSGRVFDASTNDPLPGATITIKGSTIGTVSDPNGNYSLSVPNNASAIDVSLIGYDNRTVMITSASVNVGLQPSQQQLEEVVVVGYGTAKKDGAKVRGIASIAPSLKRLKTESPSIQVENQTSVEFEVKSHYSINSDNKNITVTLDEYSLDATYEYFCAPKIDKDAFLTAKVADWSKYNLLEGEANIFFENTFVGKSVLDTRYMSDTLTLSLGRDKNVMVKREKVKELITKQFFSSKKEETRAWQISVMNNKKQPVRLILTDQVPVSTSGEIEVITDNISEGKLDKDSGEVKWILNLEPSDKQVLDLKYRVKYPKDKSLVIE